MPSRDGCLSNELEDAVFVRVAEPLRWCDCRRCKAIKPGTWSFLGCVCAACTKARAQVAALWTARTSVNVCDCCGCGWVAHSRANVCPECWDLDLCRVCWSRPGVVCDVCAVHLGTPYA